LGAFSLTKSGIKYLKTPTIKRVPVSSKVSLKTQAVGYDNLKNLDKTSKLTNKVVYPKQKLSQTGVTWSRAVISQRWRDWVNVLLKKTGFSYRISPIYQGVPSWQPAQYMKVTDIFRGTTSLVKTAPSGYEKAFKLLKK